MRSETLRRPRIGPAKRMAGAIFGPAIGLAVALALNPVPAAAEVTGAVEASAGAGAASAPVPVARPSLAGSAKLADFHRASASSEVRHVAHWVAHSGDNGGRPYMIIDKVNAKVFVFDSGGALQGSDPALLGMARGDSSADGIGDLRLAAIRPEDRTTPAGRYVASLDRDLQGREILWIDYDNALALHRVAKGQPSERRGQRLESVSADDNRVSYGCINVPVNFYEKVVSPAFTNTDGIVYILPEMSTAREFFGSYEVDVEVGAPAQP